jgi:hypothetical protein
VLLEFPDFIVLRLARSAFQFQCDTESEIVTLFLKPAEKFRSVHRRTNYRKT